MEFGAVGVEHRQQVINAPRLLSNASGHGWRGLEREVLPAEVVVHEVERYRVAVVRDLLGVPIGEAREAAHGHPHREVLPLDKRRADFGHVGVAKAALLLGTHADIISLFILAVNLDELGKVRIFESQANRETVWCVPICGHLDMSREALADIAAEFIGGGSIAVPYQPAHHELGVWAKRRPGPHIARMIAFSVGFVLLFAADKRPDFIHLNLSAWQVRQVLVLIPLASLAEINQQFHHGVEAHASHAGNGAERVPFAERFNNHGSLGVVQLVHEFIMTYNA